MRLSYCLGKLVLLALWFSEGCHGKIFAQTGKPLVVDENFAGHEIKLPHNVRFPFGGSNYDSLYVSKDGMVGFHPYALYKAEDLSHYLTKQDPAFVSPLYFPAQDIGSHIGGVPYAGQVLYRYGPSFNPLDISFPELYSYSTIIQKSVVGVNKFAATFGLVITWKDVIPRTDVADGCNITPVGNTCKSSTFQLALLTDGEMSFAIFNYINMNLTRHPNYQVGFNSGEGRGFTRAFDMDTLYAAHDYFGSDVKGRYIFRTDSEKMVRGGCEKGAVKSNVLEISPRFAAMHGGKMLDISGPCMLFNDNRTSITCRFGGPTSGYYSFGYKVNQMRARCPVPTLGERGWMEVAVSIDNGPFLYTTKILIVFPERVPSVEKISLPYYGEHSGWNETGSESLTLGWHSSQLTDIPTALVNISLYGYTESPNRIMWQKLSDIGTTVASANSYTFRVDQLKCVSRNCEDFEIGFLKVELLNPREATLHTFIASKVIPLGFTMNKPLTKQYGTDWPTQKCKAWYNEDKKNMTWLQRLENCPCNLVQALSDFGRWQVDVGCDLYDGSKCVYHRGAVHCVRSVQPSPDGSGNQCCYDTKGNLRYAADTYQGSTPDRSHTWGAAPYGRFGKVPAWSHWMRDVVTFYYCCLWTGYKDCDYYMDQRATRDCAGYNPPSPAMVYGQGHIQTFDGKRLRICAEGDFILMNGTDSKGESMIIQGRFYKGQGSSSVSLSNIGVRVGNQTVEIRLRPPSADRSKRLLGVLVDGEYHFFADKQSHWQDFNNFAVVNMDRNEREDNFTIILHNGLGVQVADCNLTLCVLFMAPPSLKNQIDGLLGNFNGNSGDDVVTLDPNVNAQITKGTLILSTIQTFQQMEYQWAVTENRNSIMSMNIIPDFNSTTCAINHLLSQLPKCSGNQECLFDYTVTGSPEIALQTLSLAHRFAELQSFVYPVRSCVLLDVPRSIKTNYNYKLGSTVTIQGCKTGTLHGDSFTYTCSAVNATSQAWNPAVTAKCTGDTHGTTTRKVHVNEIVGK